MEVILSQGMLGQTGKTATMIVDPNQRPDVLWEGEGA